MKYATLLFICLNVWSLFGLQGTAQHHHMHGAMPADTTARVHSKEHTSDQHNHEEHSEHMSSILLAGLSMNMDGSGTNWHPAASPMEGLHATSKSWMFMLHGRVFARYTNQDLFGAGYRGAQAFGAPAWVMGMAQRPVGKRGQLAFRAMFTGEPLTEGGDGYPLLFQTGETYNGFPLIDWQHPHDLFAELSVTYSHQFRERTGVFIYAALPGEPAIGPPAFMHRPSARNIPNSPVGHHWQDATHVTFGVGTIGFIHEFIKLDASIFTGREPDEERFGFDRPRFDSYSARLSVSINKHWAMQFSRAYLKGPEVHAPEIDMWRTAMSVLYSRQSDKNEVFATLVWGVNDPAGDANTANHVHVNGRDGSHVHTHTVTQQSFLAELDVGFHKSALYSRLEFLQKDGAELGIEALQDDLFWIGSGTLGYNREIMQTQPANISLGIQATTNLVPTGLQYIYGTWPVSGQLYVRVNLE